MAGYAYFSLVSIAVLVASVAIPFRLLSIRDPKLITLYLIFFLLMAVNIAGGIWGAPISNRPGFSQLALALPIHLGAILSGYLIITHAKSRRSVPPAVLPYNKADMAHLYWSWLAVCCALMAAQFLIMPVNPLAYILGGGINMDLAVLMREETFKVQRGPHIYALHFNRMLFFPALLAFSMVCRIWSRSPEWNARILLAAGLTFFNGALSTATGVIVMAVIVLGFAYLKAGGRVSLAVLIGGMLAFLAAPLFFDVVFAGELNGKVIARSAEKLAIRGSSGPFDLLLSYFDHFGQNSGFLGGRTNRLFAWATGQEYFNVQNYVFHQRFGQIIARTLHGSANANFIGYWYADFGLWGVAVMSLIVGSVLGLLERAFALIPANPVRTACYAACIMIMAKLMSAQPTSVFGGHGGVPALILAFGLSTWLLARAQARRHATPSIREPSRPVQRPRLG